MNRETCQYTTLGRHAVYNLYEEFESMKNENLSEGNVDSSVQVVQILDMLLQHVQLLD